MPRIGSRKLYVLIQREFGSQPKFPGRDKFLDLLSEQGLLLRIKRRRHYKTTDSNHPFKRYPNLIRVMWGTKNGPLGLVEKGLKSSTF